MPERTLPPSLSFALPRNLHPPCLPLQLWGVQDEPTGNGGNGGNWNGGDWNGGDEEVDPNDCEAQAGWQSKKCWCVWRAGGLLKKRALQRWWEGALRPCVPASPAPGASI